MGRRVFNFSAGPATLAQSVLDDAQRYVVEVPGEGVSALEISHRSPWFTDVIHEAESNLRLLLDIPSNHRVVFCQGGATQQFSMLAMNFLRGASSQYVLTGAWGSKAAAEARKEGEVRIAWTDEERGFRRVPTDDELSRALTADAAFVHITANETIQGVEFPVTPVIPPGVELFCDMSSDFLSRPVDVGRYGLIYAGAQKNAGPAGVTVAIVRQDLLDRIPDGLPSVLDYRTFTDHGSLYNTPPVFSILVLMLVTRWLREDVGGLVAQLEHNKRKASALYDAIDASEGFYRGHAEQTSRSLMNVTWTLPTPELEHRFISEAAAQGMIELKGHRSVGGIRASIYNAMPFEGAETLAGFMTAFRAQNRGAEVI
ncbi:MAG: phosphoserine aminotransferase [Actinomycetota bacterium]|nr:phosphoserine aminotransferase [Actinomycetota bacterium]